MHQQMNGYQVSRHASSVCAGFQWHALIYVMLNQPDGNLVYPDGTLLHQAPELCSVLRAFPSPRSSGIYLTSVDYLDPTGEGAEGPAGSALGRLSQAEMDRRLDSMFDGE